jgi:enoyl-CoA hydratase|tara:strand:- start:6794 stop:7480 length:687 start_codon:yes stop_codon:yes gene_type:complete
MLANIKTDENVSIITLDDGKANVFSPTMISEFNLLLDQVPTNKGSLLIHGRPGMFSAGFDLKVMMSGSEPAVQMVQSGFTMLKRVFSFPRPVVAACSGHAIALGAFLLCSSDHRIGAKGEYKVGANELRNNMIVPTPLLEIAKFKLNKSHKQRAILNAEMYSIEDAVEPGYLDEVVDADKVFETALAKAKDLAVLAHPQYNETKKLDQADVIQKISDGIDQITDVVAR